jgi:hypothetical protein
MSEVRRWKCVLLLVASFGLNSCSKTVKPAVNAQQEIQNAFTSLQVGQRVDLASAANFGWDRVLVVGPYTPESTMKQFMNDVPPELDDIGISNRDDIHVLLFLESKVFVRAIILPRRIAEFSKTILLQPISRGQAKFERGAKDNELVLASSA